ncbi:Aspartic proteinase 36-like protein [Drosera capensis]
MSRSRHRSAVAILLLAFILQFDPLLASSDHAAFLQPPRPGRPPPMLLPLYRSPPSSSSIDGSRFSGRHLQGSDQGQRPNARMRLYDDLLSNGYYTTRLLIGTPPQEFALIVDSGSTVTYVPCDSCEQCGNHQDPRFQRELSSTYQPLKCNPDCTCDSDRSQCTYERQYAEMSSSSGVLGRDIVSFGNQSDLTPQLALFGCENSETGDLYSQHADGIMGLGRGDLSIVDQLVEKGVISDSFSLCYGGMDVGGGAMILGDISAPSDMIFSSSDSGRSPYYNIKLKEIHVAGKALSIDPNVFDRKYGTVMDSGTTYAYLPEEAFAEFKTAILNELHGLQRISGPDPNYNDICFSGAGSDVSELSKAFPAIDLVIGNSQKLSLSPENYLFRHMKVHGAYCLGIFHNGRDPTTLLGGIIVRNTLVVYDREHSRVGFWKTNCSDLWGRLHMSDVPVPSASPPEVPTAAMALANASSGPPNYELPGEEHVGVLIFDVLLSMNYSDLKPHISELSGVLAQELGVNSSQVHLMNSISHENGSLVTWEIFPQGSLNHFSKSTAELIIYSLAEHQAQLPETFGNYRLVQWDVQPPPNWFWWEQHYVAALVSIIVLLILGLSAYGIWFAWRWRQQNAVPYKPVDAAIDEQELQTIVTE